MLEFFAMQKMLRVLLSLAALGATLTLLASAGTKKQPVTKTQYIAYVGTYTAKTSSKGIYAYRFDAAKGQLTAIGVAAETPDPSWVTIHANGKFLYAANEAGKNSTISAFAIDPQSAKLTLLNQQPALGEDPCYLSFDQTGKFLFVANYTSGNGVVFPVGADGKLGDATANVHDEGKLGPNKERQEGPHAHWIGASPDNRFALAVDLGLDEVLEYNFDLAQGTFAPTPAGTARVKPGAGPRHLAFHPNGKFAYVLSEMESSVTAFSYQEKTGAFRAKQTLSALPPEYTGRKEAAEIAVHPSGRFLYTSNRGHDSIAIFAIDKKGMLKSLGYVLTGGKTPRHFAIDPTGNYLLVENQESNNIVIFRIDTITGSLIPTGQTVEVPSPVCITFVAVK